MRRFETCLAMLALCFCGMGQAKAAPITFFQQGTAVGIFTITAPTTRETLFQALNNVTLTQFGALMDPNSSSTQFRWRIFDSDASFTFGSSISDQTVSFTDVGLTTYDTVVNASLVSGNYYILSLQPIDGTAIMSRFNEEDQGLPFTTTDANFNVVDGAANGFALNTILPSFSVSTSAIPEPSTMLLLGSGLAGLGFMRRRKKPADWPES